MLKFSIFQLFYFAHFIHSVIDNIEGNIVKHEHEIDKTSYLLFFFLVEKIFRVGKTWIENFAIKIPRKITKDDLDFVRSFKTCDDFLTFYRYCHKSQNIEQNVGFLLKRFLEHKPSNFVKYSWMGNELKCTFPEIDYGFQSIHKKISNGNFLLNALKDTESLDDVVATFQSIKGPNEYLIQTLVLEMIVSKIYISLI